MKVVYFEQVCYEWVCYERSGVQRGGERGDGPRHPKQGGIQRVKLQKCKCCN